MPNHRQIIRQRLAVAGENRNEALTAYIDAARGVFLQVTNNNDLVGDPDFLHDVARHLDDISSTAFHSWAYSQSRNPKNNCNYFGNEIDN